MQRIPPAIFEQKACIRLMKNFIGETANDKYIALMVFNRYPLRRLNN